MLCHSPEATSTACSSAAGWNELRPAALEIFQINVGRLCNMTCRHCHVDAGPDRIAENMDRETVDSCLAALDRTTASTVDITGGAPELNPHFRYLVERVRRRGQARDRPVQPDGPPAAALRGPARSGSPSAGSRWSARCRTTGALNTDAQRGDGVFEKSIEALRRLNAAGYGQGDRAPAARR